MFGPLTSIKSAVAGHALGAVIATACLAGAAGTGAGILLGHTTASASPPVQTAPATIPTAGVGSKTKAKGKDAAGIAAQAVLKEIESKTGLSAAQIHTDLAANQTLNQICGAQAQTVQSDLMSALQSRLNAAVSAGSLTQAQATAAESKAQTKLASLMNEPGQQLLASMGHTAKPAASATAAPSPAA